MKSVAIAAARKHRLDGELSAPLVLRTWAKTGVSGADSSPGEERFPAIAWIGGELGICRSILLSYGVFQWLRTLRYLVIVTVKIGHARFLAYDDDLVVQVFKDGPRVADEPLTRVQFVSALSRKSRVKPRYRMVLHEQKKRPKTQAYENL